MTMMLRYILAALAVPLVGAATAAGHALGGPTVALVSFLATILLVGAVALWPMLRRKP